LKILGELLGEKARQGAGEALRSGEFGTDLTRLGIDYVFAEVWARPGLDRRSRSLVTLGILIASHATRELRNHIRIAIQNGLTPRELEEVIIQAAPYAGFPAASPAMIQLVETLREMQIETGAKTTAERGLL
jgi:4-carboxymuconolactone decarboxylase